MLDLGVDATDLLIVVGSSFVARARKAMRALMTTKSTVSDM